MKGFLEGINGSAELAEVRIFRMGEEGAAPWGEK